MTGEDPYIKCPKCGLYYWAGDTCDCRGPNPWFVVLPLVILIAVAVVVWWRW